MSLRVGAPQDSGMQPERIDHLRKLGQRWVEEGTYSALGLLVARRGIICLHDAFGKLTPEPNSPPLPPDAIFPIASISKPISAAAGLTLVDDGELSLSRPVVEYIPEFRGTGKKEILVHHLLTHTSGLRDNEVDTHIIARIGSSDISSPEDNSADIRDRYLSLGYEAPLFCAPGTKQYYCNYAYELFGQIVERVSGMHFADYVRARIFLPLGMSDSYYTLPEALNQRVVKRPAQAPLAEPDSPHVEWWPVLKRSLGGLNRQRMWQTPWVSGGAMSTTGDLGRFLQMILEKGIFDGRRVLSKAAVYLMTRNHNGHLAEWFDGQMVAENASYGYGWHIHGTSTWLRSGSLASPATVQHGGAGGPQVWVDPDNHLVGVYFAVVLRHADINYPVTNIDLFMNAVTAAIAD